MMEIRVAEPDQKHARVAASFYYFYFQHYLIVDIINP